MTARDWRVTGGVVALAAFVIWIALPSEAAPPDPARFQRAYESAARERTQQDSKPTGSQDVYLSISVITNCPELQATFDRNMDDVERRKPGDPLRDITFSYARAANTRMKALGCFG